MSKNSPKDYAVGFKKPPIHTRFRPGVSGNPAGKAKGTLSFKAAIERELDTLVDIKEGGRTRKVAKRIGLAKRYVNQALQGDDRAFARLLPIILALESGKDVEQTTRELTETEKLILKRNARRLLDSLDDDDA